MKKITQLNIKAISLLTSGLAYLIYGLIEGFPQTKEGKILSSIYMVLCYFLLKDFFEDMIMVMKE